MDKYYKFVKASEELPDKFKVYHINVIEDDGSIHPHLAWFEKDKFTWMQYRGEKTEFPLSKTSWLKSVEPLNVEEWISVDDNLPDEKEIVLLYHPTRDRYQQGYLYKRSWVVNSFDVLPLINFTHWQLLPSAPKNINNNAHG